MTVISDGKLGDRNNPRTVSPGDTPSGVPCVLLNLQLQFSAHPAPCRTTSCQFIDLGPLGGHACALVCSDALRMSCVCSGADLPGVILQDCHYRSSPSLARAQLSAQFPAGKFCAACKGGRVSVEGKVWGWQSRGGDAGGEQCGREAPVPWMLPALQLCSRKTFPQLSCRGCFVPRIIATLSCCLRIL